MSTAGPSTALSSISPPSSSSSPSLSPTTPTPAMATSVESASVELSTDNAPLARPRPRYFDPHRYSGSASSSHASTSELHPPSIASFVWSPRGSAGSSYSLSASETPFVGLNRPLSLGYEYTLPPDVSSWGVDLDPHVKEADDEMHDPEYDFIPPQEARSPSTFDRWSVPSLRPFLGKFRRSGVDDEKAGSGRSTPVEPDVNVNEKTLEAGAGALDTRPRLHRRFRVERDTNFRNWRALVNLGALLLLLVGIIAFFVGYPVLNHYLTKPISTLGAFNLGGTNASGQVPDLPIRFTLIDPDTPRDAYTVASPHDPSTELELVFSDEFNTPGRTFYPGDDPYWEAVDLHYWPTNNLEWYDPAAVITADDGTLTITLQQKDTHDLQYQGGMIQSWNKFCFTGGYVVANVSLPGVSNVQGLWPALWMMGNLGRAGYGATTDGLWPYSYDSCDVGTVKNQSVNGVPAAASVNGDKGNGGVLSFLPGQRLSRCTCEDAPDGSKGTRLDHPGPKHKDGTWVGRAAPEIDIFEAQVGKASPDHLGVLTGQVSQSAQWAPFDAGYIWQNATYGTINNPDISVLNTFTGSVTQQATSVVTDTNPQCYEYPTQGLIPPPMAGETEDPNAQTIYGQNTGCYAVYGMEYKPGFDDAYIQWVSSGQPSWSLLVQGVGANDQTQIGPRAVPQEPMYLIANLGMSHNFGAVDLEHIPFPVHMKIDWVRVYQPPDAKNIGCDPKEFPTARYIERYVEAYTNPNLTTWVGDYGQTVPGNSFLGQCGGGS